MLKQHYRAVATKQVFQAFTDDNRYRTTNTDIEQMLVHRLFIPGSIAIIRIKQIAIASLMNAPVAE